MILPQKQSCIRNCQMGQSGVAQNPSRHFQPHVHSPHQFPIFCKHHGKWVDVGNKSQSVLDQEYKVTVLSSVVFNRSEELVGPEPQFSQWPSDENSCLSGSEQLSEAHGWSSSSSLFQSMGGAGLSEAHRGHSRKAAAKALQELAPLRKLPPLESSFTPAHPENLWSSTFRVLSSPAI